MATKPKSQQSLKLGKGKLKLWYLIPAIALVAIIGVIVVRMSGASGKVWTADQLTVIGNTTLNTKSNGTKTITAVATSAQDQDAGKTTMVSLRQDLPAGTTVNAHSVCAAISVTSSSAGIFTGVGYYPLDANGNPIDGVGGGNGDGEAPQYTKGNHQVCASIIPQKLTTSKRIEMQLTISTGTVIIGNFHETNNSLADQLWYPYNFSDAAAANKGKALPESEMKYSNGTYGTQMWDAKSGRAAYVNISAFSDSPWPGTKYCADVKGVATTSQVRMDGSVSVLNQAMGGVMTAQTVRVAKDQTATVCATADAQTTGKDYVISPQVNTVTGEVLVSKIYKK